MLRFDDQFPLHRKVSQLSDGAFRLHVEAIFWCARNLTDGFIAQDDLGGVSRYRQPRGYVTECVRRGSWHEVNDGTISQECDECRQRYPALTGNGFVIHGYLDWQQTRTKVLETRAQRAAAGKLGGIRSGQTRRGDKTAGKPPDRSKPKAKPKRGASHSLEPPYLLPSSKEDGERAHASLGGARSPTAHLSHCPYPESDPMTCSVCRSEEVGAA